MKPGRSLPPVSPGMASGSVPHFVRRTLKAPFRSQKLPFDAKALRAAPAKGVLRASRGRKAQRTEMGKPNSVPAVRRQIGHRCQGTMSPTWSIDVTLRKTVSAVQNFRSMRRTELQLSPLPAFTKRSPLCWYRWASPKCSVHEE